MFFKFSHSMATGGFYVFEPLPFPVCGNVKDQSFKQRSLYVMLAWRREVVAPSAPRRACGGARAGRSPPMRLNSRCCTSVSCMMHALCALQCYPDSSWPRHLAAAPVWQAAASSVVSSLAAPAVLMIWWIRPPVLLPLLICPRLFRGKNTTKAVQQHVAGYQ